MSTSAFKGLKCKTVGKLWGAEKKSIVSGQGWIKCYHVVYIRVISMNEINGFSMS